MNLINHSNETFSSILDTIKNFCWFSTYIIIPNLIKESQKKSIKRNVFIGSLYNLINIMEKLRSVKIMVKEIIKRNKKNYVHLLSSSMTKT